MRNIFTISILLTPLLFSTGCNSSKKALVGKRSIYSDQYIENTMKKVTDWQLSKLGKEKVNPRGWVRGTFMTGLMATYYTTNDAKFLKAARNLSGQNNWEPGARPRHADDHAICQTYIELYLIDQNEQRIEPCKADFDLMITKPMRGPVAGWKKKNNWNWVDALFMTPPAIMRMYKATSQKKYVDLMNSRWWDTYHLLYDSTAHLYYRDIRYKIKKDSSGPRTPNGKKVFWGRGNGWVIAGLARVMQYMPQDYPDYPRYVKLYKNMASSLVKYQQKDGMWRSSLNDPKWYPSPETSCSGFITYAIAWGIKNNILDKEKYMSHVKKAWKGLTKVVQPNGKVGWVQDIGHEPVKVSKNDTAEYGTGAFLLAASEVSKLFP